VDIEPRAIDCLLGPLRGGLAIVPVNSRLHPAEHAYMLSDCGARAVVLRDGAQADAAALIAWCSESVAAFKLPADIHFVDTLPKCGYGKILKREVRAALYPGVVRRTASTPTVGDTL